MEYIINIYPRSTYQDKGVAEAVLKLYHDWGFEEAEIIIIKKVKEKVLELVRKEETINGRIKKQTENNL